MSTTLTNGTIIPDVGSRMWGGDLAHNWQLLDKLVGDNAIKSVRKSENGLRIIHADDSSSEIPLTTVNDGVLTIQKNGVNVGTFSANNYGDITINIDYTSELATKQDSLSEEQLQAVNSGVTAQKLTDIDTKIDGKVSIYPLNNIIIDAKKIADPKKYFQFLADESKKEISLQSYIDLKDCCYLNNLSLGDDITQQLQHLTGLRDKNNGNICGTYYRCTADKTLVYYRLFSRNFFIGGDLKYLEINHVNNSININSSPTSDDNSTSIATTAWVRNYVTNLLTEKGLI